MLNQPTTVEVSVVLPAYREASKIAVSLGQLDAILKTLGVAYEIIVVSDGNNDATAERARKVANDYPLRVIEYQPNRGKGYALRCGFAQATGRIVGFIDADMEIDPSVIPDFVAAIDSGADAVVGAKWHSQSQVHFPLFRRLQSWFYRQIVRYLFHIPVVDTQTGLKFFWGDTLRAILPLLTVDRFAFDVEWLSLIQASGGLLQDQPVTVELTEETTTSVLQALRAFTDTIAVYRRLRNLRRRRLIPRLQPHGKKSATVSP